MPAIEYTRRQALKAAGAGTASLAAARFASNRAFAAGADDITGKLVAWDWSDAPSIPGEEAQAEFYTKYFPSLHPNLKFSSTILGYTDLLPKLTVAWRASNQPDLARVAIQWS